MGVLETNVRAFLTLKLMAFLSFRLYSYSYNADNPFKKELFLGKKCFIHS